MQLYESLECTGNLKTLECTINKYDMNTLVISTTLECTDNFHNFWMHWLFRHTHSFNNMYYVYIFKINAIWK